MKNAAAVVTLATMSMLAVGMGNRIIVDGEFPSFRFFLSVAVTGTGLAIVSTMNPTAGKGLSVIVMTVVAIDELPPLVKALNEVDRSASDPGSDSVQSNVRSGTKGTPKTDTRQRDRSITK